MILSVLLRKLQCNFICRDIKDNVFYLKTMVNLFQKNACLFAFPKYFKEQWPSVTRRTAGLYLTPTKNFQNYFEPYYWISKLPRSSEWLELEDHPNILKLKDYLPYRVTTTKSSLWVWNGDQQMKKATTKTTKTRKYFQMSLFTVDRN